MKLIVGLGNPGAKYQKNRHNVGYLIVDRLQTTDYSKAAWRKEENSEVCKLKAESIILAKPQTFMNNSGEAVAKLAKKYKIKSGDILVIRDDVDMELGKVRGPKNNTGSGGHKGVESIIEKLGGEDFYQLKIGVGRTLVGVETDEWVLSDFSPQELEEIENLDVRGVILNWAKN
jgi:PTH1 family peptidyl-tRNA hydrolase